MEDAADLLLRGELVRVLAESDGLTEKEDAELPVAGLEPWVSQEEIDTKAEEFQSPQ